MRWAKTPLVHWSLFLSVLCSVVYLLLALDYNGEPASNINGLSYWKLLNILSEGDFSILKENSGFFYTLKCPFVS